jgi:hypothetical protein
MGATAHGPNYFRDELGCAVDSRTRVLRFFGSFATRRPVRFRLPATVPLFCRSRCQVAYFITYDKNIYGTFRELPIVLCRVARVPLPARSARPSARGRGGARARAARHTRAAGVRYGPGAGAPPPDTPTSAQGQIHLIYYRVLQKTNSSSTTPPPAARRKSNWEREQ